MKEPPKPEEFKWRLSDAEAGNKDAQLEVADWYLQGSGVAKNAERAAYWFRKAADAGDSHAQYMLAFRYKFGDGVVQNDREAFLLFEQASQSDKSYPLLQVGCAYFYGEGVDKDQDKAVKCFFTSYEAGNKYAAYYLGLCLVNGYGVPVNVKQGMTYLEDAARNGNDDAKELLENIQRAAELDTVADASRQLSYQEIKHEWLKVESSDIRTRIAALSKLSDAILHNKDPLTKESISLYINILGHAAQLPTASSEVNVKLSTLMFHQLKLNGRARFMVLNEFTTQNLGTGIYVIGDPLKLKTISQWVGQRGHDYLVDMMNNGELFAFSTKNNILGKAELRVIDGDEPVLMEQEYSTLLASSPMVVVSIKSGQIGIYQWGHVVMHMNLSPGNYRLCAYQVNDRVDFRIVICSTQQEARNKFKLIPGVL
jgi:Sel1 repeat